MAERNTLLNRLAAPFRGMSVADIVGLVWYAPENLREVWVLSRDRFDRDHGTDTTSPVAAADLDGVGDHGADAVFYWPTDTPSFQRLVDAVAEHLPGSTFVDLGSGKGRTLMLAAQRPFARVVGVEFSAKLCAIAERNVAIFRASQPQSPPITTECADAAVWTFPPGPLVVYLFDPFGLPVMEPMVENLRANLQRDPRPCFVLYRTPTHGKVFESRGFVVHARQGRNWRMHHPWTVYRYAGTDER